MGIYMTHIYELCIIIYNNGTHSFNFYVVCHYNDYVMNYSPFFPSFNYYKQCCNEHRSMCSKYTLCPCPRLSEGYILRSRILGCRI